MRAAASEKETEDMASPVQALLNAANNHPYAQEFGLSARMATDAGGSIRLVYGPGDVFHPEDDVRASAASEGEACKLLAQYLSELDARVRPAIVDLTRYRARLADRARFLYASGETVQHARNVSESRRARAAIERLSRYRVTL